MILMKQVLQHIKLFKNIINQKIEGNIIECGVFKGEKISIF